MVHIIDWTLIWMPSKFHIAAGYQMYTLYGLVVALIIFRPTFSGISNVGKYTNLEEAQWQTS